jgi:hypothetical protein
MASYYNKKNFSSKTVKPYCKVCHDAGKSESEYTSHWLRASPEPGAKVTCPYLLSLECRYCKQKGHTPKACPMIQSKQQQQQQQQHIYIPKLKSIPEDAQLSFTPPTQKPVFIPSPAPQRKKNNFSVLETFIEEDERKEQEQEKRQEELVKSFPTLTVSNTKTTPSHSLKGWSKVVQTQPKQVEHNNTDTEHKQAEQKPKPKLINWSHIACKPQVVTSKPTQQQEAFPLKTSYQNYNENTNNQSDDEYSSDEEYKSSWDEPNVSWADL